MLESIRFVRGAVADKDLVPVLTHFHVEGGAIQGFDGRMTMEAPFPNHETFTVPAERFLRAVDACGGEPIIEVKEKVMVKKGGFRAVLSSLAGFPRASLPPLYGDALPGLLGALGALRPFVSTDASRLWSLGVLVDLEAGEAYATNNMILARVRLAYSKMGGGTVNVPVYAIDELLRIGEEPLAIGISQDHHLDVFWSGGRKLRASTLTAEWPAVSAMIVGCQDNPVPAELPAICETLAKLVPDSKRPVLVLSEDGVATEDGEHSASMDLPPGIVGKYDYRMLQPVLKVATHWSNEGRVVAWKGDGIEGVFIGMTTS